MKIWRNLIFVGILIMIIGSFISDKTPYMIGSINNSNSLENDRGITMIGLLTIIISGLFYLYFETKKNKERDESNHY